jgi:MFS family permease
MSKTPRAPRATLTHRMRGLPILLAGQAMASMDASILVVAAPSLRADLGATDAQLQLVVVMYTLAFAALVVTGARLGDVLGARRAFLIGLGAFSAASLAGGLAPDATTLIVARAGQGAAGALMTPQVLSIIQRRSAGAERARALSAYSLILAVGVAAGQVAGGLLVSAHLLDAAWRPALLLNAPVGALLLCARRRLPEPPPAPAGTARALDRPGAVILAAAMLALVLPLTLGRDRGWPWWSAAALAAVPVLATAFARHERRARDPLFDLTLLRAPAVAGGALAVLLIMGSYAGFLLCLTLHLQDGLGFGALRAGLVFAVYATGFAAASLSWTRVPTALAQRLPTAGPLVMAGAILVAAATGRDGPTAATLAALLVAGAGHACGFAPLSQRLAGAVGPTQAADLSGLILTASLVGSVLGGAALSGVYLDRLAEDGSGAALLRTALVIAAALLATAAAASPRPRRLRPPWHPSARRSPSPPRPLPSGTRCATGARCTPASSPASSPPPSSTATTASSRSSTARSPASG